MSPGDTVRMEFPSRDVLHNLVEEGAYGTVVDIECDNEHTPEDLVTVNWRGYGVFIHYKWRLQLVS